MLEALEDRVTRAPVVKVVTLPIPDLGYSVRDKYASPVSKAALRYAPLLSNWAITDGRLTVRAGYAVSSAGGSMPTNQDIESLLVYSPNSGPSVLYAATVGAGATCAIYNVSVAAPGAAVVSGLSSARFCSTMFAGVAATYLVAVNDSTVDNVKLLTGTTWSNSAITGVDPKLLSNVCAHKGRLWFVQSDTMRSWYLSALAVSGPATVFDYGALCKYGGSLVAQASWSYDGGSGPDDYHVSVTSEGEVIIYSGLDPNSVGEWSLVGIFKVDRPVGRKCFLKFGSDLLIYTETGPVRLSQILGGVTPREAFSDQLRSDFVEAQRSAGLHHGWEMCLWSRRGWLIVNVPLISTGRFRQYVFNPMMNSWFPFDGLNALCWAQSGDYIYFGGTGKVYRWDDGTITDDGNSVTADLAFAWYSYGSAAKKHYTLARLHFLTDGAVSPLVDMRVDYDERAPTAQATPSTAPPGSSWDEDFWDEATWGGAIVPYSQWLTIGAEGNIGSLRVRVSTVTAQVSLTGVDIGYIDGGVL
jgi:hypothetical protein